MSLSHASLFSFFGATLLLTAGCRGFITDKVETTREQRISTTVESRLPPVPKAEVTLERGQIRVLLTREQPCRLLHQDQIRTTTTYRLEPVERTTVLVSLAGTILGGLLALPTLHTSIRCGLNQNDTTDLCLALSIPPLLVGTAILIPSAGVLASQARSPRKEPRVTTSVVPSEEPSVCARKPWAATAVELVFSSGTRHKSTTDAAGMALFPVTDDLSRELQTSEGRLILWADNLPLRSLDLSAALPLLSAPARPLLPPRRTPGSPEDPAGNLW
jgi:hypothetical protein